MAKRKTTGEDILNEAENLFRQKGYRNTTMADIAQATGLLKGSLYYYYPSKEKLASAILSRARTEAFGPIIGLAHESGPPAQRLRAMMEATRDHFLESRGCLMGMLGLESAEEPMEFTHGIQSFFREWSDALAHVLQEAFSAEEAQSRAEDAVAWIEGALVWLRIRGEEEPLRRACEQTARLLEGQAAAS
jgi:TetR/AcrR family transcriptional repressor of nem operon